MFEYETFDFSAAPLSSPAAPLCGAAGYLLVVGLLCVHMRGREGYGIPKVVVAAHNLFLSAGSLVMFAGCAVELWRRGGGAWFFCEEREGLEAYHAAHGVAAGAPTGGPLFFWSYVYYLSKYYEFLDTVFVVLRGSRVPHFALQVYHHAGVVVMAWLWCQTAQSLQFGGLLFNSFVHTVMYHYYAMQVLKVPTPWKRYITRLQIVQFMTSFILLFGAVHYALNEGRACAGFDGGSYYAFWFNCAFNMTLLYSFVGVNKKYAQPRAKAE
eukprot:TRINITY_DN1631_c0_g2_i1.p1 TRINITY_DN1631_c0_g2~~TRINITY_DN1631_c0_g2_i1.p1  ORF type:complete len:268 (+),score=106.91 TRINITY_DN1631_c0_g2_i1:718-1521(+)